MITPAIVVLTLTLDELRALFREEMAAALVGCPPVPSRSEARLTIHELARAEAGSVATVRRLVREGGPVHYLGASPRFDLAEWRAWCAERGRRGTKAKPSSGSIAGVRLLSRPGR
jgi:hypothetical protein